MKVLTGVRLYDTMYMIVLRCPTGPGSYFILSYDPLYIGTRER